MYFAKGDKFSYVKANLTIKQLGLMLADQPDDKEVRMKFIDGRFVLTINDSGEEKLVGGDAYQSEVVKKDSDTTLSANTNWEDDCYVIFGSDSNTKLYHHSANECFYIDNHTGGLVLRNLNKQNDIYLQAYDTNNQPLSMLRTRANYNPPHIFSVGAIISKMKSETISNGGIHDTNIPRLSVGQFFVKNGNYNDRKSGAAFTIGGRMDLSNGVSRLFGDALYYGTTKDELCINVYAEGTGNILIQNVSGVPVTISYGFVGAYIP